MQSSRIGTVDALRGIASVAVCFFHLTNGPTAFIFLPEGLLKHAGSFGFLGVQVFFVISGFIIPYALHKARYELKHYGTFVIKRVVRLDPPYLATILFVITLGYLSAKAPGFRGPPFHLSITQVLLHLAYLNVFFGKEWLVGAFWTLAIEFQYYLLLGLLYPLISHKSLWTRLGMFTILGLLAINLPDRHYLPHWFFLFMLGMLSFHHRAGMIAGFKFWVILLILACGACYTLGPLMAGVGLATACAIAFVKTSNKALLFFGSISYSLYLVHMPIGSKVINLGSRFSDSMAAKIILVAAGFALSVAGAYLLYRFIEKPAQDWSSRIKYRTQKPTSS